MFSDLGPPGDRYGDNAYFVFGSGAKGVSLIAANSFTISGTGAFDITELDLGLVYYMGVNSFLVSIYNDNNGLPGIQVANACFPAVSGVPDGNLLNITSISGVSLSAGQRYYLVISPETLTSDTIGLWHFNNQGANTTDYASFDGGASWYNDGPGPLGAMAIQGNAAPGFNVIYNFANSKDGSVPIGSLAIDKAGNLYGTAKTGGSTGNGTVFELTRTGSTWTQKTLYSFQGGADGAFPSGRMIFGSDGSLYGTTISGGGTGCGGTGCGTVFNLKLGAMLGTWNETVLYRFGGSDGANPTLGELTFDKSGNLYGTTNSGGASNSGAVYELKRAGSTWTQSVLYNFTGGSDGGSPDAGVIFDKAGNLYGTTIVGGTGHGTVYELMPSGSGWSESVLYAFKPGVGGVYPLAGLLFDSSGNLYGASSYGLGVNGGTVFELSPSGTSWTFTVLYTFPLVGTGEGPLDSLIFDSAGNLYGTTNGDGSAYGEGNVFELSPAGGGVWNYTDFHDFTHYCGDGGSPYAGLVIDAQGKLYGTTSNGGSNAYGAIFAITP
ncbi:MAG: choice-of-anchor tandem repeat GloVer-containing protein [Candidatus Korobacteraceae bacterium]